MNQSEPLPDHVLRACGWWPRLQRANFLSMQLFPSDALPEVGQRQMSRYRQMTAAEKLACADALWDLAWDATQLGVRMRHPEFTAAEVSRAARLALTDASD